MSRLTRNEIMVLIPHAGAMCLLDEVLEWDAAHVRCRSQRFTAADNPLRRADGTLGAASGIEIAAQAMAVHGRLTAPGDGVPVPGYLVSLRDVRFGVPALDGPGALTISAEKLLGDTNGASYAFAVSHEGATLLSGRAMVMFGGSA